MTATQETIMMDLLAISANDPVLIAQLWALVQEPSTQNAQAIAKTLNLRLMAMINNLSLADQLALTLAGHTHATIALYRQLGSSPGRCPN